jgi:hypothetical protein
LHTNDFSKVSAKYCHLMTSVVGEQRERSSKSCD